MTTPTWSTLSIDTTLALRTAALARDRLGVHNAARYCDGCRECARGLRRALASVPGLNPEEWTPCELQHSFVSLLSDAGVPIEDVSRLVGHSSTSVTELVYRHQIRPVIQSGATIMDRLFGSPADRRAARAVAADNGVESQARPR